MMTCKIELELTSDQPMRDLFPGQEIVAGARSTGALPSVTAELEKFEAGAGFLDSVTAEVIIRFSETIAIGVLSNAIYDLLKAHARKIWMNGKQIRNTPTSIQKELESIGNSDTVDPSSQTGK